MDNNLSAIKDIKRLEKSFFSISPKKNGLNAYNKREYAIFFSVLLIAIITLSFLLNFDIIILPQNSSNLDNAINLITKKDLTTLELVKPQTDSKIIKNIIYINIPSEEKNGFSINFDKKINMIDSKLVIVVKRPFQNFNLDVVLRDTNLFSNARSPIRMEVKVPAKKSTYMEIPIDITHKMVSNISLENVSQIRFLFSHEKKDVLSLFVKNVFLKKRRGG